MKEGKIRIKYLQWRCKHSRPSLLLWSIRRPKHKCKRADGRTHARNYNFECDWLNKTTTLNVIGVLNCPITKCPIKNCPITLWQMTITITIEEIVIFMISFGEAVYVVIPTALCNKSSCM